MCAIFGSLQLQHFSEAGYFGILQLFINTVLLLTHFNAVKKCVYGLKG